MRAAPPLLDDVVVEAADASVTRGTLIELLADRERQLALEYLCDRDGPVALDDLGRRLAATTDATASEVKLRLHHHHLPKLDDAGVVAYAPERNVAAPTEATAVAASHFDR